MRIRPAIISISYEEEIQKALVIQRAALCCSIFLNTLRGQNSGMLLKNQRGKPYNTIEIIHVLYRSHSCEGNRLLVELPNTFILLIVDRALLA